MWFLLFYGIIYRSLFSFMYQLIRSETPLFCWFYFLIPFLLFFTSLSFPLFTSRQTPISLSYNPYVLLNAFYKNILPQPLQHIIAFICSQQKSVEAVMTMTRRYLVVLWFLFQPPNAIFSFLFLTENYLRWYYCTESKEYFLRIKNQRLSFRSWYRQAIEEFVDEHHQQNCLLLLRRKGTVRNLDTLEWRLPRRTLISFSLSLTL